MASCSFIIFQVNKLFDFSRYRTPGEKYSPEVLGLNPTLQAVY